MVIDYFDFEGSAIDESKADPPLIIDANAPWPFSTALQRLKPVVGRDAQLIYTHDPMKHREFSHRYGLEFPKACDPLAVKHGLGIAATE